MERRLLVFFICLVVFSSFASASAVSDFWGRITGKFVDDSFTYRESEESGLIGEIAQIDERVQDEEPLPVEELTLLREQVIGESLNEPGASLDEGMATIQDEEPFSSPELIDLERQRILQERRTLREGERESGEACSLLSAKWVDDKAFIGDTIRLRVLTSGDCSGERVIADFYERDFFFDDFVESIQGEPNGDEFLFRVKLDGKWEEKFDSLGEGEFLEVTGEARIEGFDDLVTGKAIQGSFAIRIPRMIIGKLYTNCVRNIPKVITKSLVICPLTYVRGIKVAGNKVLVSCNGSGAVFDGTNAKEKNGLTIEGGYNNITISGCTFRNFKENGVFLRGGGNSSVIKPGFLGDVLIENVTSINNTKNGLEVLHNVKRLVVEGGDYSKNKLNGMHIRSSWFNPKLNNNPIIDPLFFPREIRINRNKINNNLENGVKLDGSKYYSALENISGENKIIAIFRNQIWDNKLDGILNLDLDLRYLFGGSQKAFSIVKKNDIRWNRDGIRVISKKKLKGYSPYFYSGIYYIHQNNILEQKENGISLLIEIPDLAERSYYYVMGGVELNVVKDNKKNGIYSTLLNPDNKRRSTDFFSWVNQNIISSNNLSGAYIFEPVRPSKKNSFTYYKLFMASLYCNDLLNNKVHGVGYLDSKRLNSATTFGDIYLSSFRDIIENNTNGIFFFNNNTNKSNFLVNFSSLIVEQNHVENNTNGAYINDSGLTKGYRFYNSTLKRYLYYGSYFIKSNIITNFLQAYEEYPRLLWAENYWSDTSPGCKDVNKDGFCDSPRKIPRNSYDIIPSKYPYSKRPYLKLDSDGVGVSEKSPFECWSVYPPIIPPIKRPSVDPPVRGKIGKGGGWILKPPKPPKPPVIGK